MLTVSMSMMPRTDIATVLAEDAGAPELRNPLLSGMRASGRLGRLFSFIGRLGR